MEEQQKPMKNSSSDEKPMKNSSSDEIDLEHLFQMLKNGFNDLFKWFLGVFIYIKKRVIILGSLTLIGLLLGFGLNRMTTERLKIEVIVKPNLQSREYLYDVVEEIQANIGSRDTAFFNDLDIDASRLKGFKMQISPLNDDEKSSSSPEEVRYLEFLEKFKSDEELSDVVRAQILNRNSLNHRITFSFLEAETGENIARKLMTYINSNDYLKALVKINLENARERIIRDSTLIRQIDLLIEKYSQKLEREQSSEESRIILEGEQGLDITGLFGLKNNLIKDMERKRLEILGQQRAVNIINFGKPQVVKKSFFGKRVVLLPLLLIGAYLLFEFIRYLNRKSLEI